MEEHIMALARFGGSAQEVADATSSPLDEIDVFERDDEGRPLCYINKSGGGGLEQAGGAVGHAREAKIAEGHVEVHVASYVRHLRLIKISVSSRYLCILPFSIKFLNAVLRRWRCSRSCCSA